MKFAKKLLVIRECEVNWWHLVCTHQSDVNIIWRCDVPRDIHTNKYFIEEYIKSIAIGWIVTDCQGFYSNRHGYKASNLIFDYNLGLHFLLFFILSFPSIRINHWYIGTDSWRLRVGSTNKAFKAQSNGFLKYWSSDLH